MEALLVAKAKEGRLGSYVCDAAQKSAYWITIDEKENLG